VIEEAPAHHGHGLEATMGMLRKPGDQLTVIHAPAVLALEVLTDVPAVQRRRRAQVLVAGGVLVVVMHAEQKRVGGLPRKSQRNRRQDRVRTGHV